MNATYRMLLIAATMLAWFVPTAHARWYDPQTGRWLQRDPIGYIVGMNKYEYVVSNPLIHTDSYGLQPEGGGITEKVGDPSRRFIDIWELIDGCVPDMSRPIKRDAGGGKLVDDIDNSINDARGTAVSKERLMCQFWLESKFDPNAKSDVAVGIGQMTKIACAEVDRMLKRPAGTCWAQQTAAPGFQTQVCNQIENTVTYLAILLAKQTKGDIRDALKRYGPGDAPYNEYADIILKCEKCLKGKPKCADGSAYPNESDRQSCFDQADKDRVKARKDNGRK